MVTRQQWITAETAVLSGQPTYPRHGVLSAHQPADFQRHVLSWMQASALPCAQILPNIMGYSPTGSDQSGQSWYNLAIAVDPDNANTVYAGGVRLKSNDGA